MRFITLISAFICLGISSVFAGNITIKSDTARLYFAGLYPNYILYLQGGIPDDTDSAWVDKDYWAVLEIDSSSRVHPGEAVIFKLKKTSSASPQPEWCVTEGGAEFAGCS